jgi:hypothetical protein
MTQANSNNSITAAAVPSRRLFLSTAAGRFYPSLRRSPLRNWMSLWPGSLCWSDTR